MMSIILEKRYQSETYLPKKSNSLGYCTYTNNRQDVIKQFFVALRNFNNQIAYRKSIIIPLSQKIKKSVWILLVRVRY